jgi:uncharacterized protein (TIGR03083 family)
MTSAASPAPFDTWLAALQLSQRRLTDLVASLPDGAVQKQSYDDDWSIAQVLSHLGSGAEIFLLFVEAGLNGADAPGLDLFQPIWQEWNAKSPQSQAEDGLQSDAALVQRLAGLGDDERAAWRLEMFGGEQRLVDVVRLRLGEHALHSWDVAVTQEPSATVARESVDLLIDHLDQLVSRAGRPGGEPVDVAVTTQAPQRQFRLAIGPEAVALAPLNGTGEPAATLRLAAEALIRLVYGRLDADHTPVVETEGVELDTLRRVFPGV